MGYKLRHLPGPRLVEVTTRAVQRRFLLRPSRKVNDIVVGALARAQRKYGMKVCYCVYLSNHAHLLLWPDDGKQLADFMRYAHSKVAKELGRLHDWRGGIFERRYTSIDLSEEREMSEKRLRYLLAHGCKERLVASPRHWPGVTCLRALTEGRELKGVWIDRSAQYRARENGHRAPDAEFAQEERLEITPLPTWSHLSESQRQARVRAIVREIEEEVEGHEVLGREAILRQHPHDRPSTRPDRTPAPRFHAIDRAVRKALEEAYQWFVIDYRRAATALEAGRPAEFPPGSFLPSGRYVPLRI